MSGQRASVPGVGGANNYAKFARLEWGRCSGVGLQARNLRKFSLKLVGETDACLA